MLGNFLESTKLTFYHCSGLLDLSVPRSQLTSKLNRPSQTSGVLGVRIKLAYSSPTAPERTWFTNCLVSSIKGTPWRSGSRWKPWVAPLSNSNCTLLPRAFRCYTYSWPRSRRTSTSAGNTKDGGSGASVKSFEPGPNTRQAGWSRLAQAGRKIFHSWSNIS